MEEKELLPRLRELAERCRARSVPTAAMFLTPREQAEAMAASLPVRPAFFGGYEQAERRCAVFLPDYLTPETMDPSLFLRAIHASAPFSSLTHRDFLGSIMALGIGRECVGDIVVRGEDCWFFVTPGIASHVLDSLIKVGRGGVSVEEIGFEQVPSFEEQLEPRSFTVQSLRLDAVLAGAFRISRSTCQELLDAGEVNLNHLPCLDRDAPVEPGDLLSLRHHGRARVLTADGRSKKGRIFVTVGIFK